MKKIIFSNIISVFLIAGQSYDDELTGIVLDAQNNKPISDVNIFIPDQQIGATTDQNGSFVIKGQLVFPIYLLMHCMPDALSHLLPLYRSRKLLPGSCYPRQPVPLSLLLSFQVWSECPSNRKLHLN